MIDQLGHDTSSHILVPAIHRNRAEIKPLFESTIARGEDLGWDITAIADAARRHLREKFLSVPVAVSGANFGVAETGTIAVVESEGNGRMCLTLPRVLITVMGIEKVLADWRDLEVFVQLLPRSATGERMNPYTSLWTGVRDPATGREEFHLVLLDNGRTDVLADEVGRQALHCIRCSACLNSCPVYSRDGRPCVRVGVSRADRGDPDPAAARPDTTRRRCPGRRRCAARATRSARSRSTSRPCSCTCGRGSCASTRAGGRPRRWPWRRSCACSRSQKRYELAQKLARLGRGPIVAAALPGWSAMRGLPEVPDQTFREWWRSRPAPPVRGDAPAP